MPQSSVESLTHRFQRCKHKRRQAYAVLSHVCMLRCGLVHESRRTNHLASMWVEVGNYHTAHNLYDGVACRKEPFSRSVSDRYFESGNAKHAIAEYQSRRSGSLYPSASTLVALLKACGRLKDVTSGSDIHVDVSRRGLLEADAFVGSALVDMYAKCGFLAKAQEALDTTPARDAFTWTALIAGYAQFDYGEQALRCYKQMQVEGVFPTAATFVCALKACGILGALDKGRDIHADIEIKGFLSSNQYVGNALLDMYAKCGALKKAQEVFDMIPKCDAVSWNALIGGYIEHDRAKDALTCFKQMQSSGVSPTAITFTCVLKACGSARDKHLGQAVHASIERKGLSRTSPLVCTTLVDMYMKCGMPIIAREVFDKMSAHDVVSWNTLIMGYVEHECGVEALDCFKHMQKQNVAPNSVTYSSIFRACGSAGELLVGRSIHVETARKQLLETNGLIGNAIIDMYVTCGMLTMAVEVFDVLKVHDVVSWNMLIGGHVEVELNEDALDRFEEMQLEGIPPDTFTFTSSIRACGNIRAIDKGIALLAEVARKGLFETDLALGSAVIDLYANCGLLARAEQVFDDLPVRDLVMWTTLMAAYVQHDRCDEALNCFKQMQLDGFSPDVVAYTCGLKACGNARSLDKGRELHTEIARKALSRGDLGLQIALVDMYAKCGVLVKAEEMFQDLPERNVVAWNVLIVGYVKYDRNEDGLDCYRLMQADGISPDAITYTCVLNACGSLGAGDMGCDIHCDIKRQGGLESDLLVGTALVDMYAKCGACREAKDAFGKLEIHDTALWNSLINGYAQLGGLEFLLAALDRMTAEGMRPNAATFLNLLSACSHAGCTEKGLMYLYIMRGWYDLLPTSDHLTCTIDLLGRAGQVDEAARLIEGIPLHPNMLMWLCLMGTCRKWGNANLGRDAFKQAVELDEEESSAYVCMGNMFYADLALLEDV